MTIQKAPGSTVLRQIRNGMALLNIEVDTDWTAEEITALAVEEGFEFVPSTGRFRRASATPQTDTGASSVDGGDSPTSDEHTVAPVSDPVNGGASLRDVHAAITEDIRGLAAVYEPARITLDPAPVISAGLNHTDEHVRALAAAARDAISALAAEMVAAEQRGEALAEVARLEEELAVARIRAGLARPPRPPVNPEAKLIRAWAAENGVPCTRTGIVPRAVVEAYLAAHQDGAA